MSAFDKHAKSKARTIGLEHTNESPGTCAGRANGFPLRREFGFTLVEDVTLDVFRCVCDAYVTGSAQGWDVAITTASEKLGSADGPLLVARVTAFLRALKAERMGNVSYLGFGCSHVCPDEVAILTLIKSIRLNDANICDTVLQLVLLDGTSTELTTSAARLLAEFHRAQLVNAAGGGRYDGGSVVKFEQNRSARLH